MAKCQCGDEIWECECGCGCICLSEPDPGVSSECWFLCEKCPDPEPSPGDSAVMRPVTLGLAAFAHPQRRGSSQLSGSTKIRFCCHQISLGNLALALDKIAVDRICVPVARLREQVTLSMEATLEEVVAALGLSIERRPVKYESAASVRKAQQD